ncbi:MAG: hypothetical protein ACI4BG_03195 [Prevotella sp.]
MMNYTRADSFFLPAHGQKPGKNLAGYFIFLTFASQESTSTKQMDDYHAETDKKRA